MIELRKAVESVLEAWEWDDSEPRNKHLRQRMTALRQALAESQWIGLSDEEVFLLAEYPECCKVSIRNAETLLEEKNT